MISRWYTDMALCPECAELRAAVGGGRRMDKQIARTMEAKERGKTRAEQIITGQAHREGAARAQVTRELADCGVYPYQASGRRDLLAEADVSVAKIEARARTETIDQVYAEADARGADPVWQWQEVTRSIILPDYGQLLARVPDQPPGTCKDCRTGPLYAGNQCWYCNALGDLAIAKPAQPAREHSRVASGLVMILAGLLLWTWLTLLLVMTGLLS